MILTNLAKYDICFYFIIDQIVLLSPKMYLKYIVNFKSLFAVDNSLDIFNLFMK